VRRLYTCTCSISSRSSSKQEALQRNWETGAQECEVQNFALEGVHVTPLSKMAGWFRRGWSCEAEAEPCTFKRSKKERQGDRVSQQQSHISVTAEVTQRTLPARRSRWGVQDRSRLQRLTYHNLLLVKHVH
jgi:hypothetical protein